MNPLSNPSFLSSGPATGSFNGLHAKSKFLVAKFGLVALALFACQSEQSEAAVTAYTLDNLTGSPLVNPPFTIGFQFNVNTSISVTGLGVFDDGQNGLSDSYPIAIFDFAGVSVVSTTVNSGTTDSLINQFRYSSVAPFALSPGVYYIGALYLTGNDPLLFPGEVTNFSTSPEITFNANAFAIGGTLSAPFDILDTSPAYFGPNFTYTSSVIPEPSGVIALGCLFGGGLMLRCRRVS
jgi:hypothetical protein